MYALDHFLNSKQTLADIWMKCYIAVLPGVIERADLPADPGYSSAKKARAAMKTAALLANEAYLVAVDELTEITLSE